MSSSMHVYLNWTKERIDEMDATLASLEARASSGESRLESESRSAGCRSEETP